MTHVANDTMSIKMTMVVNPSRYFYHPVAEITIALRVQKVFLAHHLGLESTNTKI